MKKGKEQQKHRTKDTEISADNPMKTKYLIGERGKYVEKGQMLQGLLFLGRKCKP